MVWFARKTKLPPPVRQVDRLARGEENFHWQIFPWPPGDRPAWTGGHSRATEKTCQMKIFLAPQKCLNRRDGHVWPYLLTAALTLPLVRPAKNGGRQGSLVC